MTIWILLSVCYLVVGVAFAAFTLRRIARSRVDLSGRGDSVREMAVAACLMWPAVVILLVVGPIVGLFSRRSGAGVSPRQELDEVGEFARVVSSRPDGPGRCLVMLSVGRDSVVPVSLDRWSVWQLANLCDCAVRLRPSEFRIPLDDVPAEIRYRNQDADPDVPEVGRAYLAHVLEAGPPLHPTVGSALAHLVAASEAGDLGVMSRSEVDLVEGVVDAVLRPHGEAERTALVARDLLDGLRSSGRGVPSDVQTWTDDEVVAAARNFGIDLTCVECASLFFTGHPSLSRPSEHSPTCQTDRALRRGSP